MRAHRFEFESTFNAPAGALWRFHTRPDALERLSPPGLGLRILDRGRGVANGSVVRLEIGPRPFGTRWTALHSGVRDGRGFTDTALEGPFPYWIHHHHIEPLGGAASRLRDVVWFVPPRWMPASLVRLGLHALFRWRHRRTRRALTPDATPAEVHPCQPLPAAHT